MKYILVAGARPNFMKIAPIMDAFARRKTASNDFSVSLIHTGQHYDRKMSDDFFADLGIPEPDINLAVGSGTHAEQTARVMVAFERVCHGEHPDWVVVVGDVNSTLACSITAKKLGIRVAHVEAGLRSRDLSMPEEINRLCTDAISDCLFTTDELAGDNLRREGIPESRVHFVGNTMIDTLLRCIDRARLRPLPFGLEPMGYAVLTLHRPQNVDDPRVLAGILGAVGAVADRMPVVFPVHPRTAKNLDSLALHANFRIAEPLSYLPFLGLVANSRMVLTDSGGIQEETTVLGVPCLTMRPNTERPITCDVGTNILTGNDPDRIRNAAQAIFVNGMRPSRIPDKWDGHAAERIVEVLLNEHPVLG
jgi:UDP-N-acetylglucosamine 2-epimerase (non-hydrolysing)